jgi:hypothetical protein
MTERAIAPSPAATTSSTTMCGDTAATHHAHAKLDAALKRLTTRSQIRRKSAHRPDVIMGNRNARAIDNEQGTSGASFAESA